MTDEATMFRAVHIAIKDLKPTDIVMELHGDATSCKIVACWGMEEFVYAEDAPSRLYRVIIDNMDGLKAWLGRIATDPEFRQTLATAQNARRATDEA